MVKRAGVVVYNDKLEVLVCHPFGKAQRDHCYDLPKEHIDEDDSNMLAAAIRECEEETGLQLDEEDFDKSALFDYGGNGHMKVFFLKKPMEISLGGLHCRSLIDGSCKQKWKVGKPENDGFKLVPFEDLSLWLYNAYSKSKFIDIANEFFTSLA